MKKMFVLFAAALLLTGCSGGCSDDTAKDQAISATQEQNAGTDDSSIQEETIEEKDESDEQEAVILENKGDVEIIVPDGLESAGE